MWVGRIRRCRRRSSTCDGWSLGLRCGVVSWCSACLCGFVCFLGGLCAGCGFSWLMEELLDHLCGGFAFFVSMILGVCLF
jgi:hypothetical protein